MAQKDGQSQKTCCHCDHKATPRSSELKSGVSRRINRAIGQLNGIKTMIDVIAETFLFSLRQLSLRLRPSQER